MSIETPKYTILKSSGRIELRRYEEYITASIQITAHNNDSATNKAFRVLADYIFGNNTKDSKISMTAPVISKKISTSEKIAMTAPVTATKRDIQTYLISFTMPSSFSMEELPRPNNSLVTLKAVSSHKEVVITFSGYTTDIAIAKMTKELQVWATENHIHYVGEPTVSRYDPPWKPGFFRRNEISFAIQ